LAHFLLNLLFRKEYAPMLGLIAVLLVILWLLGYIAPAAAIGSWLPILAVIALVVVVVRLISGRHAY
jgi:hypothetical protein